MNIKQITVTIQELSEGYTSSDTNGVWAYGGKLNVQPAFQREFVYSDKQKEEVIRTIQRGLPLNVFYWSLNEDGTYELLDGQQRTSSICKYINGDFSIDYRGFHNLTDAEKKWILDYKLQIYVCDGTDKEKLDWFKIINIAGEKLTEQELRNAVFTGEWLSDAKRYFSKTSGPAYVLGSKYLSGSAIRQDYLQTVIGWISSDAIEDYMSKHQHDSSASALWIYYQEVLDWVKRLFTDYQKEQKGVDWGRLYNSYHTSSYDSKVLAKEVEDLMADDDVSSKKGIYEYLLSGKTLEKVLSVRTFTDTQKRTKYTQQKGICPICGKEFKFDEMEGDHITPWSKGGKTVPENLQMICKNCNRTKSNK